MKQLVIVLSLAVSGMMMVPSALACNSNSDCVGVNSYCAAYPPPVGGICQNASRN